MAVLPVAYVSCGNLVKGKIGNAKLKLKAGRTNIKETDRHQ